MNEDENKAYEVNIMSWPDLFLLLGFGTGSILAWGWFDTHIIKTESPIGTDILFALYGAAALYLMHRRDKNLDQDFESIEKASPKASLYVVRTFVAMMMLGAGFVLTIFINAAFCAAGFCIIK